VSLIHRRRLPLSPFDRGPVDLAQQTAGLREGLFAVSEGHPAKFVDTCTASFLDAFRHSGFIADQDLIEPSATNLTVLGDALRQRSVTAIPSRSRHGPGQCSL
jgi:hypothetical protein